jgi:hypothetical protein
MTRPRVEVRLPIGSGMSAFGVLVGPASPEGPSSIRLDGIKQPRLVEPGDWDYLPGEDQETDRG